MKEIEFRNITYNVDMSNDSVACNLDLIFNKNTFKVIIWSVDYNPIMFIHKSDKKMWSEILNELGISFESFKKLVIDSYLEYSKKGFIVKINP